MTTLSEGIDLALANKESLVVGGELVMEPGRGTGHGSCPVDSEHSAVHQCSWATDGRRRHASTGSS